MVHLIREVKSFRENLKYSFFITISLLVLDAYIQFFSGTNILGFQYSYSRVSGFFDDELVLGSYLARTMPILLALVALKSKINNREAYFSIILLVAIDILTFLSGERTAFFLITFASILLILLVKNFREIRLISFIISSVVIIIFTFTFENVKERMIDQTIQQTNILESDQKFVFSEEHNNYYLTAIKMFLNKPFFGYGPKMYREVCSYEEYNELNACSTHPHNNYLQSLAELGIIGNFTNYSSIYVCSCEVNKTFLYKTHL